MHGATFVQKPHGVGFLRPPEVDLNGQTSLDSYCYYIGGIWQQSRIGYLETFFFFYFQVFLSLVGISSTYIKNVFFAFIFCNFLDNARYQL